MCNLRLSILTPPNSLKTFCLTCAILVGLLCCLGVPCYNVVNPSHVTIQNLKSVFCINGSLCQIKWLDTCKILYLIFQNNNFIFLTVYLYKNKIIMMWVIKKLIIIIIFEWNSKTYVYSLDTVLKTHVYSFQFYFKYCGPSNLLAKRQQRWKYLLVTSVALFNE